MSDANNSQYESHLLSFCHLLARHARPNLTITRRLRESEAQPCTPVSHQHTNIFCSYHIISFPFHWTHWSGINPCLTVKDIIVQNHNLPLSLCLSLLDTISHTHKKLTPSNWCNVRAKSPTPNLPADNCKVQIPHNQIFLPLTAAETKWSGYGQNVPLLSPNKLPPFYPPFILDQASSRLGRWPPIRIFWIFSLKYSKI